MIYNILANVDKCRERKNGRGLVRSGRGLVRRGQGELRNRGGTESKAKGELQHLPNCCGTA